MKQIQKFIRVMLVVLMLICPQAKQGYAETFGRKIADHVYLQDAATLPDYVPGASAPVYTVSYVNLQEEYDAKDFSKAKVIKKKSVSGKEYGLVAFGDYESYHFRDGKYLIFDGAFSLWYGGQELENLRQINIYLRENRIPKKTEELPFMSTEEAISLCRKKLSDLGLDQLEFQNIYSFSQSDIEEYTKGLLEQYDVAGKLDYFKKIDAETAAYELIFRNQYGENWTMDIPEAVFYVHGNGTVSMELRCIRKETIVEKEMEVKYPLEQALAQFASSVHMFEGIEQTIVITSVAYGYGFDSRLSEYESNRMVISPYWIIRYNIITKLPQGDHWQYDLGAEVNLHTGVMSDVF